MKNSPQILSFNIFRLCFSVPLRFHFLILILFLSGATVGAGDIASVFFSPNGGCTPAAVAEIGKAKEAIVFEAYSFTSPEILQALQGAIKRGVTVRAIYDRSQKNDAKSLADELGVERVYGRQKIMHDKVIVIDAKVVVTGSFNFTVSAEKFNAENMVVLRSPELARKYLENFEKMKAEF
jgi:phosphatidylserine/phosphatidylglycerophosphate/cardiolipin synthase-like enzyme